MDVTLILFAIVAVAGYTFMFKLTRIIKPDIDFLDKSSISIAFVILILAILYFLSLTP